jgi:hypothetical protein
VWFVMRVPLVFESGQCLCGFGCSQYQVSLSIVRLVICIRVRVLSIAASTYDQPLLVSLTFSIDRAHSMVKLRISTLQRTILSTPPNHLLNIALPRRLFGRELPQKLNKTLYSYQL